MASGLRAQCSFRCLLSLAFADSSWLSPRTDEHGNIVTRSPSPYPSQPPTPNPQGPSPQFAPVSLPDFQSSVPANFHDNPSVGVTPATPGLEQRADLVPVASAPEGSAHPDAAASANQEQKVDPWDVKGAVVDGVQMSIDYAKLIEQFGTRPIGKELLDRFEKLTNRKPHIFLRRGMFFSHR